MSQFLMDKATMALNAQRYEEAISAFEKILENGYNPQAWCGLGLCKLFQLAKGYEFAEVLFCFSKALSLENVDTKEVKQVFTDGVNIVISRYADFTCERIKNIIEAREKQAKAIILASAATVLSLNSSGTTRLVSGLVAGASAGVAIGKFGEIENEIELGRYSETMINSIGTSSLEFLTGENELISLIEENLSSARTKIFIALPKEAKEVIQAGQQLVEKKKHLSGNAGVDDLAEFLNNFTPLFSSKGLVNRRPDLFPGASALILEHDKTSAELDLNLKELSSLFDPDEVFLFALRDQFGWFDSYWTNKGIFVRTALISEYTKPKKRVYYKEIEKLDSHWLDSQIFKLKPTKYEIRIGIKDLSSIEKYKLVSRRVFKFIETMK